MGRKNIEISLLEEQIEALEKAKKMGAESMNNIKLEIKASLDRYELIFLRVIVLLGFACVLGKFFAEYL